MTSAVRSVSATAHAYSRLRGFTYRPTAATATTLACSISASQVHALKIDRLFLLEKFPLYVRVHSVTRQLNPLLGLPVMGGS